MAEGGERSPLLPKDDNRGTEQYTAFVNLDFEPVRRPSVSSVTSTVTVGGDQGEDNLSITVDELLYRIKYAFLQPRYDVVNDVMNVLNHSNDTEVEDLLQNLNATPLKIQQKLKISKLLHTEGNLKRRYRTGGLEKIEKKKGMSDTLGFLKIWETTITRITATFGSNVASYFQFVRTLVFVNLLMAIVTLGFITLPQLLEGNLISHTEFHGHFGDLSDSFVFYGLYMQDLSFKYNMGLAYFLAWLAANLVCFIVIITVMTVRYRKTKLNDERGHEYKFAWRSFCTWDHSITSRQGVLDHRTSFRTDMKELIREEKLTERVEICKRLQRYLGRLVSNVLVVSLLVGSGYLIYTVADNRDWYPDSLPASMVEFFQKYQLTAVVAGLKFCVPIIFQQLIHMEGWLPRIETNITLTRTTIFYLASVLVFVASLYEVAVDCNEQMEMNTTEARCCWENEVGEEVVKVILLDLGILVAVGIFVHLARAIIVKSLCCPKLGYSRFDVVSCVLDVVYGQGLIWLGLYFSPLLAAVGLVKLVIIFYFRLLLAKVAMDPPQQLFRASSTGNFYLAILLLNLFVSLFPMAYAVLEFQPSSHCGPFRQLDRPYDVISQKINDLPNWLEDTLNQLSTPAILVPILILFVLSTIFFHVKSSAYRGLVSTLRKQLQYERRVEKRKIFATGRAMSGGGVLSRYTSQESLISNVSNVPPASGKLRQRITTDVIEEERHDIVGSDNIDEEEHDM